MGPIVTALRRKFHGKFLRLRKTREEEWSGLSESNRHLNLGKVPYYHYTKAAQVHFSYNMLLRQRQVPVADWLRSRRHPFVRTFKSKSGGKTSRVAVRKPG